MGTIIVTLRYVHGAFTAAVLVLIAWQMGLGLRIRRARRSGAPAPAPAIRGHRRSGPLLPYLAAFGFLVGILLSVINERNIFFYPLHLSLGTAIVALLFLNARIARKIKGPASPLRGGERRWRRSGIETSAAARVY